MCATEMPQCMVTSDQDPETSRQTCESNDQDIFRPWLRTLKPLEFCFQSNMLVTRQSDTRQSLKIGFKRTPPSSFPVLNRALRQDMMNYSGVAFAVRCLMALAQIPVMIAIVDIHPLNQARLVPLMVCPSACLICIVL